MKVLIIDDEFPARKLLSDYVSKIPNLQLVDVCEDAMSAIVAIQQQPVDLILSDIQMPELSGLDLIRSLNDKPMVIFTTAYSEYAIDSYELEAIDYLLKPISFPRFTQAINKAVERFKMKRQMQQPKSEKDFFMVKADYKLYKIEYSDLLYVEGQSEYVTFHLKELEEELPQNEFVRIHKSYIVAISQIEAIEGNMVSVAGQKLAIGKNYKDALMERLG